MYEWACACWCWLEVCGTVRARGCWDYFRVGLISHCRCTVNSMTSHFAFFSLFHYSIQRLLTVGSEEFPNRISLVVIGLGLRWSRPPCFSYYCSYCCLCRKQRGETEIVNGEVRLAGLWLVLRRVLLCSLCCGFSVWQIGETGGSMVLCLFVYVCGLSICWCWILHRNEVLFHWVCFPRKPDKSWKLKLWETEWASPAASVIEITLSRKDRYTDTREKLDTCVKEVFPDHSSKCQTNFPVIYFNILAAWLKEWCCQLVAQSICWSNNLSRE